MTTRTDIRHTKRSVRAGFSLLEIMLVVVIIGLLMSVAAWNIIGTSNQTRNDTSRMSMNNISNALKAYNLRYGAFPPALLNLTAGANPFMEEKYMKDAWKRDFIYIVPGAGGKPFTLISPGPDGEAGNADDIDFASDAQ